MATGNIGNRRQTVIAGELQCRSCGNPVMVAATDDMFAKERSPLVALSRLKAEVQALLDYTGDSKEVRTTTATLRYWLQIARGEA